MNGMSRFCVVSCTVTLCALACGSPNAPQLKRSYDGTLAISTDGALLYTANPDTGTVSVVDSTQQTVTATVTVGQSPARIVVGADDTLYVSNEGSRSVSVIHRGNWTVASTINVGADPVGLALSADGNTLYVANMASGTVDAMDLTSPTFAQKWETQVGDLPRGVAVLPDGRLYVTHYKNGMVHALDGSTGAVLTSISTNVGLDPNSAGASVGVLSPTPAFRSTALDSIAISPDGSSAYFVHRRDNTAILQPQSAQTPVVVPALTTVLLASDTARDDATDANKNFPTPVIFPGPNFVSTNSSGVGTMIEAPTPAENEGEDSEFRGSSSSSGGTLEGGGGGGSTSYGVSETSFEAAPWTQGAVALVEDPAAQFLYVANVNSDNVTVLSPTNRQAQGGDNGIVALVPVGTAPNGLALSPDGKTLYVHNSFDYSISVIQNVGKTMTTVGVIPVATSGTLDQDTVQGRTLFYSASDPSMTVPGGGVACESCHLSGSSDGNVWQFPWGPRKTPSLMGRKIQDTAPYHWDGTEVDFDAFFTETVQVRMGGQGVSSQQISQITTFLQNLGTPDNPFRQPGGLTAAQQAGQALFTGKAGCASCHSGANFTDNGFHDVGTLVTVNPNGQPDDPCRLNPAAGVCQSDTVAGIYANPDNSAHGFNTPSLLGVVWAAPYLHSGAALTLTDRVTNNPGNLHGNTEGLSADDISNLVAYLETL